VSDTELATIEEAIAAIAAGQMVVVVDSADRENEGDLVMAAEHATADAINFMATYGRGLICVPLLRSRLAELGIPPMVLESTDPHGTAFHVSVDHRHNSTTGISASERAYTIRALIDPEARPSDFSQPGHVFPLACRPGGVLTRAGHTEAAVDLVTMAGLRPGGVICEIVDADGEMARLPRLLDFAETHGLLVVTVTDLIAYRRAREKLVERVSEASIPLDEGEFRAIGYRDRVDGTEHVAFTMGEVANKPDVLVRVHSECLTGDVFGSRRCDCGRQLHQALRLIADEGCGVVVYLRGHEGRGIGLLEKLHAYRLQDDLGLDTVDANLHLGHPSDKRDYGVGMQILSDLGIRRMRLLTNNPAKRAGLEGHGLSVTERVPLQTERTAENRAYLDAKRARLGHMLDEERTGVGSVTCGFLIASLKMRSANDAIAGAALEAKRLGGRLLASSAEYDAEQQVKTLEQLIDEGVDAIAIMPVDADAVRGPIERALSRDIPVVYVNSDDPPEGIAFTSTIVTGRDAPEQLAARMAGHAPRGRFGVIGLSAQGRPQGTLAGMIERAGQAAGLTLAGRVDALGHTRASGAAAAEELLATSGPLDCLWVRSDTLALGAADVVRARGETLQICSNNAERPGIEAVADGTLDATYMYPGTGVGVRAFRLAYLALTGAVETVESSVRIPGIVVTKENAASVLRAYFVPDEAERDEQADVLVGAPDAVPRRT
jgi:3,4-dihydroxy 2-butanone 4-phosphate synthase/GTP cyclohydrolase II